VGSFLFALLFTACVRRRIGGLTGDTLGASCELTELVPALVASAWLYGGGA
jgi:adenosylcobinamide-GDP ribazoletransferase